MKKFLTVIAFFQLQCAGPVININLELVDDWKTNIYYYQFEEDKDKSIFKYLGKNIINKLSLIFLYSTCLFFL